MLSKCVNKIRKKKNFFLLFKQTKEKNSFGKETENSDKLKEE